MDRSIGITEYDSKGNEISRRSLRLVDPADTAADRLEAQGASRTGRITACDSTAGIGPFFKAVFDSRTGTWPFAFVWVRETDDPWHSGWGPALRFGDRTYVVGVWRRTERSTVFAVKFNVRPV